ncbi:MAG: DUF3800 domain-containing protein [Candidatus Thermoplasmatota archaeon]|nr:DUF3800 domain-containing protein [Candidatus Thermoplasmatota archaeon]
MEYVCVDTSGDLDPKGSHYFIVCFLAFKDRKKLEKSIENCRKKFGPDEPELKFGKSDERVRKNLLTAISRESIKIGYYVVDKRTYFEKSQVLFPQLPPLRLSPMFALPLHEIVEKSAPFSITYDVGDFQKEIIPMVKQLGKEIYGKRLILLNCKNSRADKCLQAADFVAGAIFQAYEKEMPTYFNLISKKIAWHVII